MRNRTIACVGIVVAACGFGCQSKASDDQLVKMCEHLVEIIGENRGTSEEEAVGRIEEEYAKKEKDLKDEMARDLKGMDDVLSQKLAKIESGEDEEKDTDTAEPEDDGKKAKGKKKKDEPPELTKEEKIKAAREDIAKQKKEITDQFERLIKVLGPQKKYAIRDAKKYVAKRQKASKAAFDRCIKDARTRDISEEKAACRVKVETRDEYFNCK